MRLGSVLHRLPGSPPVLIATGSTTGKDSLENLSDELVPDKCLEAVTDEIGAVGTDKLVAARGDSIVASTPREIIPERVFRANEAIFTGSPESFSRADLPEVGRVLEDSTFLYATPEGDGGSLLLTAISRYIEAIALESGSGTLRSGFQKLSRLRDDWGTREVYRTVSDSEVGAHIYGVPDWIPPADAGVTVHAGYTLDFRKHWFVAFDPPSDASVPSIALLVRSLESDDWYGAFSRDDRLVSSLLEYLETEM